MPEPIYAHSLPDRGPEHWETLRAHLLAVGETARRSAAVFGWGALGEAAGRLHDIGKCSAEFQAYIAGKRA